MDRDPENPSLFQIAVFSTCLFLGALHLTESSALSGRALPEPFTRPMVALANAKTSATTPVLSRHSHGTRVERFESRLKKFFYEPLGFISIHKKGLKG